MTDPSTPSTRPAAFGLVVSGLLTVVLSFSEWGSCPTTPCGGNLFSISEYSGIDLGFGVATAVAGIALVAIGLEGLRRTRAPRMATIAGLIAVLNVATAGASVIWMYVLPGEGEGEGFYGPLGTALLFDTEFYWPPYTAIALGCVGLIALAASLSMRGALRRLPRR